MLALVAGEALLGHLEGGFAPQPVRGDVQIKGDGILPVQVEVQLFHRPGASAVREPARVGSGVDGLGEGIGAQHMGAVAVLPVQVVADHHQGPAPADTRRQIAYKVLVPAPRLAVDLLRLSQGLGPVFGLGIQVWKIRDNGVVSDAHRPKPVQLLVGALVVLTAVCLKVLDEIDHLDGQLPLHGVIGQQAGEEKLLVVGVGGDQHQVGLLQGRLPHLNPAGQLPG